MKFEHMNTALIRYTFHFSVLFFSFLHGGLVFGSEVTVFLKGSIPSNSRLKVYYYRNLEEKVQVSDEAIEGRKEITFQLNRVRDSYFFFEVNNKPWEALIDSDVQNSIVFDFNLNDWVELNNGKAHNAYLFDNYEKFRHYDNVSFIDSASYVNYHLKFMESLRLFPMSENMEFNQAQNYSRKVSFGIFCNTVLAKKLFDINSDFTNGLNRSIRSWAHLGEMELENAGFYDFLAVRNFHRFYAKEIFPSDLEKPTFYKFLTNAEEWLNQTDFSPELKAYILGDIVQFYIKLPFEFEIKSTIFLKKFLEENPNSRHYDFIHGELTKRGHNSLIRIFDPYITDINSRPFNLQNVEEKIIYVDFWATWCKPCLEENRFINQLEERFSGEVLFLKVSIDEDRDKWKLSHNRLNIDTSYSYILEGRDREVIFSELGLQAIPKFLIIDKKGNIIDTSPLRPSNPELVNQLSSVLNNLK